MPDPKWLSDEDDAIRKPTLYIATHRRAFGASTLQWGPFTTLDGLKRWADKHNLTVAIETLIDPHSNPSEWWELP